jgi:hypothetical protein
VDSGSFIKGSITYVCGTCSRAHCICTQTPTTQAHRLTNKDDQQKTQIVYIPRSRISEMNRLIANYARAGTRVQQIIETNIAIFKKG